MRFHVETQVPQNSFDYFEKTLITGNGFREYDVRWLLGKEINPNGFLVLGKAFGTFTRKVLKRPSVVVGHDFRIYSQDVCRSFVVGLLSSGVNVVDIGMVLSPMLYFAQHHLGIRAAAMITASHNENGWTGLKLANGFSSTLGPEGILQFKEIVQSGDFWAGPGQYEIVEDTFSHYLADIVGRGKVSRPIKVVLAAGNGTAGRFAPTVLRELGCEVIEQDCTPDWNFGKHNPNPEDIKFLHAISHATVEAGADLGIGIDGDGDRIGVVDDQGNEIFSDKLGLLLARWMAPQVPKRALVIDVKSTGLFYSDPILQSAQTPVVTWKTGHSYIKAKVAETDAFAGFEKSGHWFLNHPFGRGYDDAPLSAAYVVRYLAEAGRPLSQLVAELPKTWQSPTMGPYCADDVKYNVVDDVTHQYEADRASGTLIAGQRIADIVTVNGVRFVLEDSSFGLVRASSNKPQLVMVAEARGSEDQLYEIIDHIRARLAATGQVGEYDQEMPERKK
jgi:phosphomannomutase/phosphoglucomutase